MLFDFNTFSKLVKKVYTEGPYTLEQVLSVLHCYFSSYELRFGVAHPNIRMEQIQRIVRIMPYMSQEEQGAVCADIEPEEYKDIITRHFQTKYRSCDYNINHFFSGRVRELRFYEACLGGM